MEPWTGGVDATAHPFDIGGRCRRIKPRYKVLREARSAACGSASPRAYRPHWRRGRVAEGGGLLNRYRVVKPYRGFESLRLRQTGEIPGRNASSGYPHFNPPAMSRFDVDSRCLSTRSHSCSTTWAPRSVGWRLGSPSMRGAKNQRLRE